MIQETFIYVKQRYLGTHVLVINVDILTPPKKTDKHMHLIEIQNVLVSIYFDFL